MVIYLQTDGNLNQQSISSLLYEYSKRLEHYNFSFEEPMQADAFYFEPIISFCFRRHRGAVYHQSLETLVNINFGDLSSGGQFGSQKCGGEIRRLGMKPDTFLSNLAQDLECYMQLRRIGMEPDYMLSLVYRCDELSFSGQHPDSPESRILEKIAKYLLASSEHLLRAAIKTTFNGGTWAREVKKGSLIYLKEYHPVIPRNKRPRFRNRLLSLHT